MLFPLALLAATTLAAEPTEWSLSADNWARPRDGQAIVHMAPIPEVVEQWSKDTGRRLVIHYPGGEEGQLWAFELRSWLVALGIPQDRQELLAGGRQTDRIEIELSR